MYTSGHLLRQPLIKFLGRRSWPRQPPRLHPSAPPELESSFTSERETAKQKQAYTEFWEAPARIWRPRYKQLEDVEIDAVLSGGATLRQP